MYEILDSHIGECEVLIRKDRANQAKTNGIVNEEAKKLANLLVGVYQNQIKDIKKNLYGYNFWGNFKEEKIPSQSGYIDNVIMLKDKLRNYRDTLKRDVLSKSLEREVAFLKSQPTTFNVSQNVNNEISIKIDLEQTIDAVWNLSDSTLGEWDKKELEEQLYEIQRAKRNNDKGEIVSKVGKVLKFIAEKGVEVGIATLPYIMETLKYTMQK